MRARTHTHTDVHTPLLLVVESFSQECRLVFYLNSKRLIDYAQHTCLIGRIKGTIETAFLKLLDLSFDAKKDCCTKSNIKFEVSFPKPLTFWIVWNTHTHTHTHRGTHNRAVASTLTCTHGTRAHTHRHTLPPAPPPLLPLHTHTLHSYDTSTHVYTDDDSRFERLDPKGHWVVNLILRIVPWLRAPVR